MGPAPQAFPTARGIAEAAAAVDPVFRSTPLVETPSGNDALGLRLLVKAETLNPIRSFKGRGAERWMAERPAGSEPIVCASAGNFGQGVAYAAARRGRRAIVFAAAGANPAKVAAMRRLGAEVVLGGDDLDAAKEAARAYAAARGLPFVEDGAERLIAEGAGTIAKEITDALAERGLALDAILVPLGNGALLAGIGAWMKAEAPSCRVLGVVAAGAPAMKLSWEQGRPVATDRVATAADGIAIREPIPYALEAMRGVVDDVLAVGEADLAAAQAFLPRHYGLLAEPAGAAGLAALLASPAAFAGRIVATVLCGSNGAEAG